MTSNRFNRLYLNLASFIAHLEEGIESLRKQSEFEVEKVMDFEIRLNDLFACAYIKVKWKPTLEYPEEIVEWIPYCNFKGARLFEQWINDPSQNNHWVRQAISSQVLEVDGVTAPTEVDLDSATRFRNNPAVINMETAVDELAIIQEQKLAWRKASCL